MAWNSLLSFWLSHFLTVPNLRGVVTVLLWRLAELLALHSTKKKKEKPIRRKCSLWDVGFSSNRQENDLNSFSVTSKHCSRCFIECPHNSNFFCSSKAHNCKHTKHKKEKKEKITVKACVCVGSTQVVFTGCWDYLPQQFDIPTPWLPSWQVQSRHRQLEYRCSTLKQPPQRSVSGDDGWIPVRYWRTRQHYCHKYSGEVQ